jgi:hypothetical protein
MTGTVEEDRGVGRANRGAARFSGSGERDDLLMEGAVARWLAAVGDCLLGSVNSIFLDLSCGDRRCPGSEERNQVIARSPALAVHIVLVALPLGHRVVLVDFAAEEGVLFGHRHLIYMCIYARTMETV